MSNRTCKFLLRRTARWMPHPCRAGADFSTTAARRMEAAKPKVLEGLDALAAVPAGAVVSVSNFDGVHLGHERILATARELKQKSAAPAVAVVTFEPHPT